MFTLVGRKILALLLAVICPTTIMMADRPSAMLVTSGTVRLNGTPTPESSSVFNGDVIDTADGAVGSLTRNGSSIVVDPDSSIRYQDDGVSILKGMARIQTYKGLPAHAGPISIVPVTKDALFDVRTEGKTALIASREGALLLTDGTDSYTLNPGYTAKVDISQDQQAPKPAAKGGEKKRRAPPIWLIWVLIGAGAAAAITCGILCGKGGTPVSPVTP